MSRIIVCNITNDAKNRGNCWDICDQWVGGWVVQDERALETVKINAKPLKLRMSNKTLNCAKLRKILVCSYIKSRQIKFNTRNRFWKKLVQNSGPGHFKSSCSAVLCHCSLHFFTGDRRSLVSTLSHW